MKKIINKIKLAVLTVTIFIFNTVTAYADGPISAESPDQVSNKIYQNLSPVIKSFGGLAVFLGVVAVGFSLIASHKNAQRRSDAMTSMLYIGGGAIVLGAASLIAGFMWGLGQ